LLDIEGTTTPIDFVYQVLFPYARGHVKDFLASNLSDEDVRADIAALYEEHSADLSRGLSPPALRESSGQPQLESIEAYVHWLMGQDRKSTALKSLQGRIWKEGYHKGELSGQIFPDVPRAFERWRKQNRDICIYSSGSRLAQELLFAHTECGDLTGFIRDYFDTNVGAKVDSQSYHRIASALKLKPPDIVFISDVTAELNAARSAGMQTLLSVRPGNPPQPGREAHPLVRTFDEVLA
jgi:enolase-phosphatase E1